MFFFETSEVKIYNCGVCGTDCHIFHGDITNVGDKFIPGHEAGGIVVEIGNAVTSVAVGDKVAIDPNKGCHKCNHCQNSNPHFCKIGSFNDGFGIVRNGGFSEFAVAPAESIYKIPENFNLEHLSLVEPLSCIVHGWRKLSSGRQILHGTKMLIQGAGEFFVHIFVFVEIKHHSGIIGSLWACLLHYKGYRNVTVSEPSEARRGFIDDLQLGFKTQNPTDVSGDDFG